MDYDFDEFVKLAKEKFGDKVYIGKIIIGDENLDAVGKYLNYNITKEDLENYGNKVWLIEPKCPNCGSDLDDVFDGFKWGLAHGYGFCSHCNSVDFQYYHYIIDSKRPLELFAISGFN